MNKFREAAKHFMRAHHHPEKEGEKFLNLVAAKMYKKGGEWEHGGSILFDAGKFRHAGKYYKIAKKYVRAANSFEIAGILVL